MFETPLSEAWIPSEEVRERLERAAHGFFGGLVGHEDQRDAAAFVGLLDDLRKADAFLGHAAGQVAQHAGGVVHHEADIVAGAPFFRRHHGGRFGPGRGSLKYTMMELISR